MVPENKFVLQNTYPYCILQFQSKRVKARGTSMLPEVQLKGTDFLMSSLWCIYKLLKLRDEQGENPAINSRTCPATISLYQLTTPVMI
jgi:hypothetical protein